MELLLAEDLEGAEGVAVAFGLGGLAADQQPSADGVVEAHGAGVVAKGALDGLPIFLVEAGLLAARLGHEQVVAHHVGGGEGDALGVETLEDGLRVVVGAELGADGEKRA